MIGAERIDLLPGFVAARKRARRLLQGSSLVASAAAVACGITFVSQSFTINAARSELQVQQAENAAIAVEVNRLADLEVMANNLAASRSAMSTLLANEVRWSVILRDLQAVMPNDTWLTGMNVVMTPENPRGLAEISFQGTTYRHNDVVDWLQRLDRVPAFTDGFFTISSKRSVGSKTLVTFSSTVTVTELGLRSNFPGAAR